MKNSAHAILTTHAGSLPRPEAVIEAAAEGSGFDALLSPTRSRTSCAASATPE